MKPSNVIPNLSRREFLNVAGTTAAVGILGSACAPGSSTAAVDSLSFQFNWIPGDEHAPYFVAREKGYFSDERLEVDLRPGRGSTNTVVLAGSGDANLGVASADAVAIATGNDVPVVAVAAVLQEFPYVIAVREDSDIMTPQDFAGKTILLFSDDVLFLPVVLPAVGLTEADVSVLTIGEEVPLAPMLLAGEVDVIPVFYYNQGIFIEAEGVPLRYFFLKDLGIDLYGHAIVTSQNFSENNSELVQRFLNASIKGWIDTIQNTEEAIDILIENTEGLERETSLLAWERIKELALNADTQANGFGWQTEQRWQSTIDTFVSAGVIESAPNASDVFTNQFLEAVPDRSV